MGVRRILIAPHVIALILREGLSGPARPTLPIQDAEILDVRKRGRPDKAVIELLVESPTFDGPGSEGRWPQIAEGRWDEFPQHEVIVESDPWAHLQLTPEDLRRLRSELARSPGPFVPAEPGGREPDATLDLEVESRLSGEPVYEDPDDRCGEVPGA